MQKIGLDKFSGRALDDVLVGDKLGSMPYDPGEKWVSCTVILFTPGFGVWVLEVHAFTDTDEPLGLHDPSPREPTITARG